MTDDTATETRVHATPLYPGVFMPEEGPQRRVDDVDAPPAAIAAMFPDERWYAIEVRRQQYRRWTSGAYVEWRPEDAATTYRILVGEQFTPDQVAEIGGASSALASNARSWGGVVRTRLGNWQPLLDCDVVFPPSALAVGR